MRMRKKKNLPARIQRCKEVIINEPEVMRGKWLDGRNDVSTLFIELGCGKGRFTAELAKSQPESLIVAIERVPDAMIVAMERAVNEKLHNTLFIDTDAKLLTEIFDTGEADRIYINFCDPWPKKKQAKRRLTHSNFLKSYRQVLKDGGEIHFKTDNVELFQFSLQEFAENGFDLHDVTYDLHKDGIQGTMTDYEAKFHDQGIHINHCVAVLKTEV